MPIRLFTFEGRSWLSWK